MYNKCLLFSAYWSNAEDETTENKKATNKTTVYNDILLYGGCFLVRNCNKPIEKIIYQAIYVPCSINDKIQCKMALG